MGNNVQIVRDSRGYISRVYPGATVTSNNQLPEVPTNIGNTLEHIKRIQTLAAQAIIATQPLQRYELESIANQIKVAGMPEPTILQKIAGIVRQNYSREKAAAEKTVSESARISRGIARGLRKSVEDIPDAQIHGYNSVAVIDEVSRIANEITMQSLAYAQTLAAMYMQITENYLKNSTQSLQALQSFRRG